MPSVEFNRYYKYDELTTLLSAFAAEYPQFVSVASMGKSYEGRDIWVLTITNAATELLEELYGENGLCARASIGCQGLAFNHSVELVTTLEFKGTEVRKPLRRDAFRR